MQKERRKCRESKEKMQWGDGNRKHFICKFR